MNPTVDTAPEPLRCAEHPSVETYLRCGRCDKPICPKCMIQTPVGARCRDCARMRPLPMYEVGPNHVLRGIAGGVAAALGVGVLWSFVPGGLFFLIWTVIFVGYGIGEAISRSANRKRGRWLMATSVVCVFVAFIISRSLPLVFTGLSRGVELGPLVPVVVGALPRVLLDPFGLVLVVVGCVAAAVRLR